MSAAEMADLFAAQPLLEVLALLVAGLLAGFVNVVAGGGSLLSVPLLIFLGLPETVANGTSRLAILAQSTTSVTAFARAGKLDYGLLARLSAPALAGAALGAYGAARMADAEFRAALGAVMLACAALVVVNPRPAAAFARPPRLSRRWVWPALFVIGLYGGAIQAGVGYLILAVLVLVLRIDLVQANVMKVVLVGLYTPLALALFVWQGRVDLWFGLALSAGQALGGFIGAIESLARGERFVRATLALVVVLSGLKLLFD
jgi:uncharacterized protein